MRGVLAPAHLLDYLRYLVLFEDDGMLVKKIAGFCETRQVICQAVRASAALLASQVLVVAQVGPA